MQEKSIGIGGVMAEVAFLQAGDPSFLDKNAVPENELILGLCRRFNTSRQAVIAAINLAEQCGVIVRIKHNWLRLLPRPKT
jgi:hypothetical protein